MAMAATAQELPGLLSLEVRLWMPEPDPTDPGKMKLGEKKHPNAADWLEQNAAKFA
jgi:hypothetical protein